jgi:hypothetical protein
MVGDHGEYVKLRTVVTQFFFFSSSHSFTDYISPRLTRMMIENGSGRKATTMKDKKGFLPVHVACSRHCSPEKLHMLLQANPASIFATTNDGMTLLGLAKSTATRSHPNFALINALTRAVDDAGSYDQAAGSVAFVPARVSSDDTADETSSKPKATTRKGKKKAAKRSAATRTVSQRSQEDEASSGMDNPADLLLHFSRAGTTSPEKKRFKPTQYAEV